MYIEAHEMEISNSFVLKHIALNFFVHIKDILKIDVKTIGV